MDPNYTHPLFAPNYTHFWNLNFLETIQPNSAWSSLSMCLVLILTMKENETPKVKWFFRKKREKVASNAHQSFNQSSNNMGVRIVWCKKGVRIVWVHPSYINNMNNNDVANYAKTDHCRCVPCFFHRSLTWASYRRRFSPIQRTSVNRGIGDWSVGTLLIGHVLGTMCATAQAHPDGLLSSECPSNSNETLFLTTLINDFLPGCVCMQKLSPWETASFRWSAGLTLIFFLAFFLQDAARWFAFCVCYCSRAHWEQPQLDLTETKTALVYSKRRVHTKTRRSVLYKSDYEQLSWLVSQFARGSEDGWFFIPNILAHFSQLFEKKCQFLSSFLENNQLLFKSVGKKKGVTGNWTRDHPHPKRISYP